MADGIIAGTITAGAGPDSTGAVMRCAAASDGVAGLAGTAAGTAADVLSAVAARAVALPFTVVAPKWVAVLFEWAAAVPVAEPAWAA